MVYSFVSFAACLVLGMALAEECFPPGSEFDRPECECDFGEIICDSLTTFPVLSTIHGDVVKIVIFNGKFTELNKSHLKSFPNLTELDLNDGSISKISNDAFEANTKLESLSLQDNRLTSFPPVTNLPLLRYLYLRDNYIQSINPEVLHGCFSLITMHVSKNDIKALRYGVFRDQHTLVNLDLSDNKRLSTIDKDVFENTKIQVLKMEDTAINRLPSKGLRASLQELFLSGTKNLKRFDAYESGTIYTPELVYDANQTYPFLRKARFFYHAHCCQMSDYHSFVTRSIDSKRDTDSMPDMFSGHVCVNINDGNAVLNTSTDIMPHYISASEFCAREICRKEICGDRCEEVTSNTSSGGGVSDIYCIPISPSTCLDQYYSGDSITSQLTDCTMSSPSPSPSPMCPNVCANEHSVQSVQSYCECMYTGSESSSCITCLSCQNPHGTCEGDFGSAFECLCGGKKRSAEYYWDRHPRSNQDASNATVNMSAELFCAPQVTDVVCRVRLNLTEETAVPVSPHLFSSHTQSHVQQTVIPSSSTLQTSLIPTSSTLQTSLIPSSSTLQTPLIPTSSTLQTPQISTLQTPLIPTSSTLQTPQIPSSSTLQTSLIPSSSTLQTPQIPTSSTLQTPLLVPTPTAVQLDRCGYDDIGDIGPLLLPSGWFYPNPDSKQTICSKLDAVSETVVSTAATTNPRQTVVLERGEATDCNPEPNDFNPCQDLLGNDVLRAAIWLVIIFAILGNGLVVFVFVTYAVIIRRTKVKFFSMHFLYANLASADFLMSVYLLTLASVDVNTKGHFSEEDVEWRTSSGCGFAGFCAILSTVVSVYTLVVITTERLYTLTYVMHRRKLTKVVASTVMACGWLLGVVMAMLPLVGGVNTYELVAVCLPFDTNSPSSLAYISILLIMTGLSFVYIAISYSIISYQVILSPTTRGLVRSGGRTEQWRADVRIAIRMFILVITNFVCWFPIALVSLTAAFGEPLNGIDVATAKFFVVFVFPVNACLNPFLYTLSTRAFKYNLVAVLKRCGLCRKCSHSTVHSQLAPSSISRTIGTTDSRRGSVISHLLALNFTMFTNRRTSLASDNMDSNYSSTNLRRPSQISMDSSNMGSHSMLNVRRNSGLSQNSNEDPSCPIQVSPLTTVVTHAKDDRRNKARTTLNSASSLGILCEVEEGSDVPRSSEPMVQLNPGYEDGTRTHSPPCNGHAVVLSEKSSNQDNTVETSFHTDNLKIESDSEQKQSVSDSNT